MKLVVVESPAKAKTIEKYLGGGYRVLASYGHVRDLPPKDGSVDPDAGFAMQWEVYGDKAKQLKAISDEAMKDPRGLDEDLIDAYRARRALDYLVGFTLSPVLWRKLPGAKSAGRVQSVALRLIVDREREIELFRPQEYWSVAATMEADGTEFLARLVRFDGEKIHRLTISERGDADAAKAVVEAGRFS